MTLTRTADPRPLRASAATIGEPGTNIRSPTGSETSTVTSNVPVAHAHDASVAPLRRA
jgi:hypothetical protein